MTKPSPYVITVSHQLGSGGAYLGRKLAAGLKISYADREILERAADALNAKAADLEALDESAPSFLDSVLKSLALGVPEVSLAVTKELPTYRALREAERAVILGIAAQRSAVIVGHAGYHLLASHPRHISVFVHASDAFRAERIETFYEVTRDKAFEILAQSDTARARYLTELTSRSWTDATQFDLSLRTSSIGLDATAELLLELVHQSLPKS